MTRSGRYIKFLVGLKLGRDMFIVIVIATYLIFKMTLMASIVFLDEPEVYTLNDARLFSKSNCNLIQKVGNPTQFELITDYFDQGKTDLAISGYRQYLQTYSGDVLARLNLSSILMRKSGSSEEAYMLARKALDLCPEDPICQLRVGEALIAKKRYRAALEILKKTAARQRNPDVIYKAERHMESIRNQGLDLSYWSWVKNLIRGDLGKSATTRQPIKEDFLPRLKRTLFLVGGALVLSALGILLGIFIAKRPNFFLSRISAFFLYIFSGVPTFLIGYIAVETFRHKHGSQDSALYFGLMMLSLAIGNGVISLLFKNTRLDLAEILTKEYIRVAKAKGVKLWKHWGKNLMVPVITNLTSAIPTLLGGTIIIEMIFEYEGLGIWVLHAAEQKDLPVLMFITTVMVILVCIVTFIRDILHIIFDPRLITSETKIKRLSSINDDKI